MTGKPARRLPWPRSRTDREEEEDRAFGVEPAERLARLAREMGVYVVLAVVLLAAVAISVRYGDHPVVERFGPNIATEVLSIIVTLAFVQRLLEREERARKMRAAVGALRKGRTSLSVQVEVWATLVKAALDARRTEYPRTVQQLFAPYYTEELACLEPSARSESGELWLRGSAQRLDGARRTLHEVILTYGATLDADYLEALAEVVDDPFTILVVDLATSEHLTADEWRLRLNRSRGHLSAHFVRLVHAVRLHNRLAHEAARFRSRHLAPTAQSLSIQLGADRDLAVQTELPPGWWTTEPAIGSLRAARA